MIGLVSLCTHRALQKNSFSLKGSWTKVKTPVILERIFYWNFSMLLMTLLSRFKGQLVGQDKYGNRYFEERFLFSKPSRPPRRWVLYKGYADASKVPPEWHGWLHFTYEAPLEAPAKLWQKSHLRNMSGTQGAYLPAASLTKQAGERQAVRKPYEAWTPEASPSSSSQTLSQ